MGKRSYRAVRSRSPSVRSRSRSRSPSDQSDYNISGPSNNKWTKMGKDKHDYDGSDGSLFRVPPYCYLHVLDQTTNVTRVEIGPQTFIRKDNEKVLMPPTKMIIVPPRHYCVIRNPVHRDDQGELVRDKLGQVKLWHAETEVRLEQEPFPLFPGEDLDTRVQPLTVVHALCALRLRVTRDFVDEAAKVDRVAGDEFLFEGPGTFIPRKELEVLSTEKAVVIKPNEAFKLRAKRDTIDRDGVRRVAGEEWLVRRPGAYLPGAYEEAVAKCAATILTDTRAVHVCAIRSFTDQLGVKRKNGEEYLITHDQMESFIPDVYEKIVGMVDITTLTIRQYCVVVNPVGKDGKPQLGHRLMIKGEKSFFLRPGEELENGIQDVYVLGEDEGLVLRALEMHSDSNDVQRQPGDRWMLKGPMEYIPNVEVEVVAMRKAMPLHENEGIYVRNNKTGSVRAVIGQTYMLGEDEELWAKRIPAMVKTLLSKNRDACADRGEWINPEKEKRKDLKNKESDTVENVKFDLDPTRVVTFQVPHNAACQL